VLIMLFARMRVGEGLALRWRNVNLTDGVVHIGEAVTVIPKFDRDGNVISRRTTISNTKTCASVRSVPMPQPLTDALRKWKEQRTSMQEKASINFVNQDSLVFSTDEGTLRTYSGLRTILNRFLRRYGMDKANIHFHTFRHTFATMLFESGVNPRVVQLLMGHKDVETTLAIYTHVGVEMFTASTAKLDGMFREMTAEAFAKSA